MVLVGAACPPDLVGGRDGAAIDADTTEPSYLRSVYQAGPGDLVDLLRDVPPGVESVLILGHNPTMEQAIAGLTGEPRDFPTGAIAALDVTGTWSEPSSFEVAELATPKDA